MGRGSYFCSGLGEKEDKVGQLPALIASQWVGAVMQQLLYIIGPLSFSHDLSPTATGFKGTKNSFVVTYIFFHHGLIRIHFSRLPNEILRVSSDSKSSNIFWKYDLISLFICFYLLSFAVVFRCEEIMDDL